MGRGVIGADLGRPLDILRLLVQRCSTLGSSSINLSILCLEKVKVTCSTNHCQISRAIN